MDQPTDMDDESLQRLWFMICRQNEAAKGPTGTWRERWLPWVCQHWKIRCVHADEILARGGARRMCMVCGRSLKGPIPARCFFTGQLHDPLRKIEENNV